MDRYEYTWIEYVCCELPASNTLMLKQKKCSKGIPQHITGGP